MQITVRKGVEPWLTLGTWAPVGSRQGYVLDTLSQPQAQRTANQETIQGVRGIDRLPNDLSLARSEPAVAYRLRAWLKRAMAGFVLARPAAP